MIRTGALAAAALVVAVGGFVLGHRGGGGEASAGAGAGPTPVPYVVDASRPAVVALHTAVAPPPLTKAASHKRKPPTRQGHVTPTPGGGTATVVPRTTPGPTSVPTSVPTQAPTRVPTRAPTSTPGPDE